MKKYYTLLFLSILFISNNIKAQESTTRPDKLYTMSGIGFSLPVGETSDYLKPKFSTSLGLNLGLGKGGLFLYPKVSLHAYSYNEITPDAGYNYALKEGRVTTYLLNVMLGYRKITGKFAFYGFAGGGGGIILTPRVTVNTPGLQAKMDNISNGMGTIEAGAGTEYNIGGAALFVEASYMRGFSKIQNRNYSVVPISVGIKPNLSKLFRKK
ncbi:hypothetical protein EZ428_14540 [Pedobacter frigiditerrae]|uniref:Outer membrane protein beta-barrel domain-containing protein n=1 Tax=Pedobacter frigiditerrae TaxID=2530452 RepID=A0A4R0MTS9_9SPHI|nr:hypothetical protein [Pedobacter frigiditerrae]TCC90488.1 hypothetical protein EZ428_14540 [Pedobacter frigiditerrae]